LQLSNNNGGIFSIKVDKLLGDSIEQYSIKYIQNKNNSFSDFIPILRNPFEIIEYYNNYSISNISGNKLVYKYPCMPDLAKCSVLDIWAATSNKDVFHLIYQATPNRDLEKDISYPIVIDMIKSFRIDTRDQG
jgi:hypothetical protein